MIESNKENLRYLDVLVDEFMHTYSEKVNDLDTFMYNLSDHTSKYENILYRITNDIQVLQHSIQEKSPETMKTLAEKFCETQNSNDSGISNFLKAKDFDDVIDV